MDGSICLKYAPRCVAYSFDPDAAGMKATVRRSGGMARTRNSSISRVSPNENSQPPMSTRVRTATASSRCSGFTPRRLTDEVDSVALADLAHLVGVAREVLHLVGNFAEKAAGVRRGVEEEHARRLRAGALEGVHGVGGDVDEVAAPGHGLLIAEGEANFAVQDVVTLVPRMLVRRRTGVLRRGALRHRPRLAGPVAFAQQADLGSGHIQRFALTASHHYRLFVHDRCLLS